MRNILKISISRSKRIALINVMVDHDTGSNSQFLILQSPMDSYGMQKTGVAQDNDVQGQAFWFSG